MFARSFLSIFLWFSYTWVHGQGAGSNTSINNNLLSQAYEYSQLVKGKDFSDFIDKIYPKLVSLAGGRDSLIMMTTIAFEELKNQGITIDSVRFSEPNPIIEVDGELQTTMREIIIMTIPNGKMVSNSTMIAISQDDGLTWYFLDTNGKNLQDMKKDFTNLDDRLIVYPFEKPTVFRD